MITPPPIKMDEFITKLKFQKKGGIFADIPKTIIDSVNPKEEKICNKKDRLPELYLD